MPRSPVAAVLTAALAAALAAAPTGCGAAPDARAPTAAAPAPRALDRDRWRQPDRLVALVEIAPGMRLAEVGAGAGYLTPRLAAATGPAGRVVATDVDAWALARQAARPLPPQVELRVVDGAPGLEPAAYDRVVLAQVDQHLGDRAAWLRTAAVALAPGGRLVVQNRVTHRAALLDAARAAGLSLHHIDDTALAGQFVAHFQRPAPDEVPTP